MPPTAPHRKNGEFTGRLFLALALGFFGVVIAVNVGLAVVAGSTFPGLVVENSYTASQHYNTLLAAAREQDAGGLDVFLAADGDRLRVTLTGTAARLGLTVVASVGRPSSGREDRTLAFVGDGRLYQASESLPRGMWNVEIDVKDGDRQVFRRTDKITIDGGRND
ncbi:MAG: FixH family protein [Bauldia sp.]